MTGSRLPPARHVRRGFSGLLLLLGLVAFACGGDDAPDGAVHVITIDGDINPVTADFLDRALDRAGDTRATVAVIQLDTPGGLISATDDIVQRIEASTVPVAVFVSPLGARAASAGTFITMAGHIAAMAPSTQIGAATPIGGGGEDIEGALGDKITNDAAADIRAIAELRGRNADWAERAVREAISATSSEALELNVIDLIATDLDDLLAQIDGREVELAPGKQLVTIHTAGAPRVETNMTFFESFLDLLSDPNIAFLLLSLGGLAIFIEILSGFSLIAPGVFGVIAMVLAFFSLGTLDTNPAGIVLVLLAFVLFLAEVFAAGFGVFGIGGIVALILGGILLISDAPDAEQVSLWVLAGVGVGVVATLIGAWLVVLGARREHHRQPGLTERLVGHEGRTRTPLAPEGTVLIDSELWTARSVGSPIPADTRVRVLAMEGLCLIVEPLEQPEQGPPPAREPQPQAPL